MGWRIRFYESSSGQSPVEKFIRTLQPQTRAKLVRQIDLLSEFGPQLGMPNAKPIGDDLYELRVRGREEIRTIYIFVARENIVILHGFKKKTMSISKNDLHIAKKRKAEIEKNQIEDI